MLRSEKSYPLVGLDLPGGLQQAWENGWLDEFSDDHFVIKAIEKRLEKFPRLFLQSDYYSIMYPITHDNFQDNFCINFSRKIVLLIKIFGEKQIEKFFKDQLSAGKKKYNEDQFFRALSEVSILSFYALRSNSGEYEPKTNGLKNPEARFNCKNGVTVDVEVKTPGFNDFDDIKDIVIPTVLLDKEGRTEFIDYCNAHGLNPAMPRVMKLKDFLNSAAEKFEDVDHIYHMNFLYINWSLSEFEESGYEEAFSLLANNINGILAHKSIGLSLGVNENVYERITAVIVYTESLHGLMFGDFTLTWCRGRDLKPQFGIFGMHNCDDIYKITGMNPFAKQMTPIITGVFHEISYVPDLMKIIHTHLLTST